ncbi:aspartic proteinase Asp1-like [Panicum virgatum]|uniref:aspartic proteinase Asp1-like n=1 Tax=Panicum virgatum TaxID=38727 RepID=UPI0019D5D350|nr:aspartic proteinase Asp1-like [Panicum virgatum]
MVFKLDGNVYPTGHFYVTMNIGEPAKPYFLDIDTGSNLTWLECNAVEKGPCLTCNKVPHPLYRPTRNKLVPCADPLCDTLHHDLGTTKNCRDAVHQCDYEIAYLDGSTSLGVLLRDKFSLPTGSAPKNSPTIAFGCGYDQVHDPKNAAKVAVDGILGLGRGSVDLVSQLKRQGAISKNVIGHCLSTKGGGYLFMGEENVPSSQVTWVPIAPRTPGPNHYSPGQATLYLDTKSIGTKSMQVVLDSGSTYTYLPGDLHTQLVSTLKASLSKSLKEVPDPALPLCWKGPRPFKSVDDLKKEFKPLVSLKFGGGVTMAIPPENYLVITEHGNACFGILAIQGLDMYLIGDITMQDQLMIYDNEKGRIGWMPSPCDKMPKSKAVIISRI